MIIREFATKTNDRKNSKGEIVEKTRIWIEESENNRFLTDNGLIRGERVSITIDLEKDTITILLDEKGSKVVAGKGTRSLFDIVRNRSQIPECMHPSKNKTLQATIEFGKIVITCKRGK